ncbi:MAG: hypothetical protein KAG97_08665, partial [Victivallales bacterium]|nr:hypothetical protein [Victivallales bacterium]
MVCDFKKGVLPENWLIERSDHYFECDGLHSGGIMTAKIKLSGNPQPYYEMEFSLSRRGIFTISDDTCGITLDFGSGKVNVFLDGTGLVVAESFPLPDTVEQILKLCIHFSPAKFEVCIDDVEVCSMLKSPDTLLSDLYSLSLYDDCVIAGFTDNAMPAENSLHSVGIARSKPFHLEVNVDFYDDLVRAPFTTAMIEGMFDEFKSWGVKRCHWIYYGGRKNGWWSECPSPVRENAEKTFANAGDIFSAAVKAAHKRGIELYGLIKPFDMGFHHSYSLLSTEIERRGKLSVVGGEIGWIADFPAKHREYI